MNQNEYVIKEASEKELAIKWEKSIAEHKDKDRWRAWRDEYINDNLSGKCKTFVIMLGDDPVGEGTLLFSPECCEIGGRLDLADNSKIVNVNALRIEKPHEGKGHISRLVKIMESYAKDEGYEVATIGVEAKETRNIAIYLHMGYTKFVRHDIERGELLLYFSKTL